MSWGNSFVLALLGAIILFTEGKDINFRSKKSRDLGDACKWTFECPAKMVCTLNGICWWNRDDCKTASDCGRSNQECSGGYCSWKEGFCEIHGDCRHYQKCDSVLGRCYDTQGCKYKNDCPKEGETCGDYGDCVQDPNYHPPKAVDNNSRLALILALAIGMPAFVITVGVILCCCFCSCCPFKKRRDERREGLTNTQVVTQDVSSSHLLS